MQEKQDLLLTGCAGFIGFCLAKRLLEDDYYVVGLDNLNDYYDVNLKKSRLELFKKYGKFLFLEPSIEEKKVMEEIFKKHRFQKVIHLAAQAGVRYSLKKPHAYINSNVVGFMNILEGCRHREVKHLIFASSSSVYGSNKKIPFSVHDNVDHPISLYGASKKSNELMAHTYSHLFGLPCTGLRFLQSMDHGEGRIWLYLYLLKQFWLGKK